MLLHIATAARRWWLTGDGSSAEPPVERSLTAPPAHLQSVADEMLRRPVHAKLGNSLSLSARSMVTHAVLGSEAVGLHMLPPELLLQTFSKLDPTSLCRLAQCSRWCRLVADDAEVWAAACSSHAPPRQPPPRQPPPPPHQRVMRRQRGYAALPCLPFSPTHPKEVERLRCMQLAEIRAEIRAAEERVRRERWRRLKRRGLLMLQAAFGVGLILTPLLALVWHRDAARGRLQALRRNASATGARAAAGAAPAATASAESPIQSIVWAAACGRR